MANSTPHICFFAPNAYPLLVNNPDIEVVGGAELQQVIVARELVKRGYKVSMICLDFGQGPVVEVDGIHVIRSYSVAAGVPVLRSVWPRLASTWRCLKLANADIYYQRAASRAPGISAYFCRRFKKKAIFAAAGNPDLWQRTPRIRSVWDRWIYEYGLRNIDRIVVQNVEQARLALLNFNRESIFVPNCYPEPTPSREQSQTACDVLWVSTIRKLKRPELLLEIARQLPGYRFKFVGGPDRNAPGLYHDLLSSAAELGNVAFQGYVPYQKVEAHFDSARIFVNTSESEGYPNTFLQAWARGIPTVSFIDCGAQLAGQPIGRIVESVAEMKDTLVELLQDPAAYTRESDRCRSYYYKMHTPSRVLDIYERLFQDLLTEKL